MTDDRTAIFEFPLPHQDNTLLEDVARLRAALNAIETAILTREASLGFSPENPANKGQPNGYAGLDATARVPASQLPSYVDDVVEVANFAALPGAGEQGKIYVTLDSNKTYRWGGSSYIEISASPGSTDAVPEGAVNKYFTGQRARDAQNAATTTDFGVVKVGSGLNMDVNGKLNVVGGGGGGTQTFTEVFITPASNGQTSFAVSGGYIAGQVDVFLNGVLLYGGGDDYTATDGSNLVLVTGASTTDTILVRRWAQFDTANNTLPKTGGTMTGTLVTKALQETSIAMAANNVDISAANYFRKTISGATTLTVSSVPASGTAACFILELTNGGSVVITWWAGIEWANGVAPTLTASGRDVLGFFTRDGGTTWTGLLLGKDVK